MKLRPPISATLEGKGESLANKENDSFVRWQGITREQFSATTLFLALLLPACVKHYRIALRRRLPPCRLLACRVRAPSADSDRRGYVSTDAPR